MFGFEEELNELNEYGRCVHLQDFAEEIGADISFAAGLSKDMEEEQLQALAEQIKEAIEQRQRELDREGACYIGPYANNYCTICGGRQPGTQSKS
jgi:hypothetical protein